MSNLALSNSTWIRTRPAARRRKSYWQEAKESRLTLRPIEPTESESQWPAIEEQCKTATTGISQGRKAAIALLRSFRDVSEAETQEQRETWKLLEQALDEDRYH
jgi:hypothetical protein